MSQIDKDALWGIHRKMVLEAGRERDQFVWGKQYGPNPRFFIVGDEPYYQDYITGEPFSAQRNDIIVRTVQTLDEKYGTPAKPISMESLYVTYFVKTSYQEGELTEAMFLKEWLPTVQLEFALSGCTDIVPLSPVVRMLGGHIAQTPAIMKDPPTKERNTFITKTANAVVKNLIKWNILKT